VIEVHSFSLERLNNLFHRFSDSKETLESFLANKTHLTYLNDYLSILEAKTILVETDYVDRDYLEDYAGFYVRCFNKYQSRCTRLHFFSKEITLDNLKLITKSQKGSEAEHALKENYLGFIVIKPLPQAFVGRTCLKTYPHEDRRFFPVTRDYNVHLIGLVLSVNSLAFQQQDRVTAACATSALWSVFQGTGILFHHSIPSPTEITKKATDHIHTAARAFPNSGLIPVEMAAAIKGVGLEPEIRSVDLEDNFKAHIYSYLKAGIPLILNAALVNQTQESNGTITHQLIGYHAVAISGYSVGSNNPAPHPSGTFLKSSRIDKIYVHDDQVGPFARLSFQKSKILNERGEESFTLLSSWKNPTGELQNILFIPTMLILPLYNKIRLRSDQVLNYALQRSNGLDELIKKRAFDQSYPVEWDLSLTTEDKFKNDVRGNIHLNEETRWEILNRSWPKFIWRVIAEMGGHKKLEFVLDATDFEGGDPEIETIIYDVDLYNEICSPR
jgi:hypothetical protein